MSGESISRLQAGFNKMAVLQCPHNTVLTRSQAATTVRSQPDHYIPRRVLIEIHAQLALTHSRPVLKRCCCLLDRFHIDKRGLAAATRLGGQYFNVGNGAKAA